MPVSAETLRLLIEAGLSGDELIGVVASIDADGALAPKARTAHAIRQERYRQRLDVAPDEWEALRSAVFERDEYACVYCGDDVYDDPQCDHVVPLARGGVSTIENLATACKGCNSSKRDVPLAQWRGRQN